MRFFGILIFVASLTSADFINWQNVDVALGVPSNWQADAYKHNMIREQHFRENPHLVYHPPSPIRNAERDFYANSLFPSPAVIINEWWDN
jgi:hypothetical protein